ncbi:hypothetical protein HPB50_000506 [Hyalomma asiaticum]|uniref:Uncharacterized protein n=1 Tax=Hyalomma asiaticum TaxID=266040 RepID=A0ACB7RS97_HYAAI|nr:hypothetical protein HPB50_000506 [Hyalomma asiaticum]
MGKPVQIVSIGPDQTVQLNKQELERILLAANVKDKPVAVVSIIGAFRKGKSFLLNFLLRYQRSPDKLNWMSDEDTPLTGFSWSQGSQPNTKGLHVWDEVFLVPTSSGEELAVLLMDTQGAFDSQSSADETANLFALSILTSSVQIYNISHNMREDHLQHLQLVAEYGKLVQEDTPSSPCQKLVYLIRDWEYPFEAAYGATGGRTILSKFMSMSEAQPQEKKDLRQSLSSCFSSTDCFLMPHPGEGIKKQSFDGRLRHLGDDFKRELKVFASWLMAAENLDAKEIAGEKVTCEQLMNYFTANCESVGELHQTHSVLLEEAMEVFRAAPKIGGDEVSSRYMRNLEKEIAVIFNCFSYQLQLSELEEKQRELEEDSNNLNERQRALSDREEQLQRESTQLRLHSSDIDVQQRELDENRVIFDAEMQQLRRQHRVHSENMRALDERKCRLERERRKLISQVSSMALGTGIALAAVASIAFPPVRLALGAATVGLGVLGGIGTAMADTYVGEESPDRCAEDRTFMDTFAGAVAFAATPLLGPADR